MKDEYEGESAKTTLIPVKERFAKAVTAAASKSKRGKALDVIADATDSLEATSAVEPAMDTPPWIATNDAVSGREATASGFPAVLARLCPADFR